MAHSPKEEWQTFAFILSSWMTRTNRENCSIIFTLTLMEYPSVYMEALRLKEKRVPACTLDTTHEYGINMEDLSRPAGYCKNNFLPEVPCDLHNFSWVNYQSEPLLTIIVMTMKRAFFKL